MGPTSKFHLVFFPCRLQLHYLLSYFIWFLDSSDFYPIPSSSFFRFSSPYHRASLSIYSVLLTSDHSLSPLSNSVKLHQRQSPLLLAIELHQQNRGEVHKRGSLTSDLNRIQIPHNLTPFFLSP